MRPTLPRSKRTGSPSRIAKGARANAPASGGPVAPTAEYVSRRTRRIGAASRAAGTVFPRRRPSVVARRSAFAILLFLSMALLTVSYRGGAVLHGVQLAALEVVAPIERGLSRAWDPIAGAWNWGGNLLTATSENPKLERENAELRAQLRAAQIDAADFERMRRAAGFQERMRLPEDYDRVFAQVAVRVPGAAEKRLVIDRGSDDGIQKDDAVMVTDGLLGRVTDVTSSQAVVELILHDAQNVSASVVGSEAWGVLQTISTEGSPVLQLRFASQSAKVEEGNLVVTSGYSQGGLSAVYPGNIPVGVVSVVGYDPADMNATIQVTPLADFDRIDEVFVLVPKERGAG